MNARIKVINITSYADIDRTEVHNFRQQDEQGFEKPDNIKVDGEWKHFGSNSMEVWNGEKSISDGLKNIIKTCIFNIWGYF